MKTILPLSIDRTVSQMYRLASQYWTDVLPMGWTTVPEVFGAIRMLPYTVDAQAPECGGAVECVKRPGLTLVLGGDCDDKAVLSGAAMNALNIPWHIVTSSGSPDLEMEHTYIEIVGELDGKLMWLPFDATKPDLDLYTEHPYTAKITW